MYRPLASTLFLTLLLVGCSREAQTPTETGPAKVIVSKRPSTATPADKQAARANRQKVTLADPGLSAGIHGKGPLSVSDIEKWLSNGANHEPLELDLPMWLTPGAGQIKDLRDNPMTRAKVELGRQLFFDKRLSEDNTVSCATCHEPGKGYTVDIPLATGIKGQVGKRNPPTLLNRIMLSLGDDRQFWDGRSLSVEDALLHALTDPTEMAASSEEIIEKLKAIEGYRLQFDGIYGDVTWDGIGDAVGCFVRCLVTGPSPYDYYEQWERYKDVDQELLDEDAEFAGRHKEARLAAEAQPMSESARRGEYLFFGNKAWCSACHNGVNFTDELYHNIGIGLKRENPDLGRYSITKKDEDWGAFKTPTVRGSIYTAPYMHDGSLATLEDVVEWYAHEGQANRNLDYRYKRVAGEELTEQDKKDLVEFVKACSGPLPHVEAGRLPE
jgi:cytochrome c peroxidase